MKFTFSAVVAVVLLAIYTILVVRGIQVVLCVSDSACTTLTKTDFNDRMASSLALIGGLVAALVIAELSVTKPGQAPLARVVDAAMSKKKKGVLQTVTVVYLIVWLVTGISAFYFGYLVAEPDVLPPLADLGQAWLGIAVGAGYAYFGIEPG